MRQNRHWFKRSLPYILAFSVGFTGASYAADKFNLMGAEKALSTIERATAREHKDNIQLPASKKVSLLKDLEQYKKDKAPLDPEKAADIWLSLYDRFWSLPAAERITNHTFAGNLDEDDLSFQSLVSAIPGPDSWKYLRKQLKRRSDANHTPLAQEALEVIVLFLNGEFGKARERIDDMEPYVKDLDRNIQSSVMETLTQMRLYLGHLVQKSDADSTIAEYRNVLAALRKKETMTRRFDIPDLVLRVGKSRARELIEETLGIHNILIRVPSGGKTLSLVKQILIDDIQRIDRPQWQLVSDLNDLKLYQAMQAKFGTAAQTAKQEKTEQVILRNFRETMMNDEDESKLRAQLVYAVGLINAGRINEAVNFTLSLPLKRLHPYTLDSVWSNIGSLRIAPGMFAYCSQLLRKEPDAPLWSLYSSLAVSTGHVEELLSRLDERAKKLQKHDKNRLDLDRNRIKTCLAIGQIDQALDIMRKTSAWPMEQISQSMLREYVGHKMAMGNRLYKVGQLLNRQDLIDEGIDLSMKTFEQEKKLFPEEYYYSYDGSDGIYTFLVDQKRFAEAEQFIIRELSDTINKFKGKEMQVLFSPGSPYLRHLSRLAKLYQQTGRDEDVLFLFQKASWWGKKDLLDIDDPDLALTAAKALRAVGRTSEAIAIVKHFLYDYPANDALYGQLVAMTGPGVIPWLDDLYERDHFEERPLIWKASVLFNQGDLKMAEKTIRQALKIDPTDGEQKAGDRVRAYAVLSEILSAEGKTEEADFFMKVVESVRIAEQGDAFKEVDMIQQSLERYAKAQVLFSSAYCVQWRMAERLYELGKQDEAKKHYEIAFERMPEQFGQVASFCFGCEGVFSTPHSRSIAEIVLLRLEKSHPDRPQVHFLLGQLRDAQKDYISAYRHFKKAVALDHQYLDAWKEINSLKRKVNLDQHESDNIILTMIKMDPLMKHFSADLDRVADLKSLWNLIEKNRSFQIAPPTDLLVLPASRSFIESYEHKLNDLAPEQWAYFQKYSKMRRQNDQKPGLVIAQHVLVKELDQILNAAYGHF